LAWPKSSPMGRLEEFGFISSYQKEA